MNAKLQRLTKEQKSKWLEALRSGEYEQYAGGLKTIEAPHKYCCLGVLCELLEVQSTSDSYITTTDEGVDEYLYLGKTEQTTLADMNDDGLSFKIIADYIEEDIDAE